MWIDKARFAKLLQENEGAICWQSEAQQNFPLVHTWTHEGTGEVILREYWHVNGEILFWACDRYFKG